MRALESRQSGLEQQGRRRNQDLWAVALRNRRQWSLALPLEHQAETVWANYPLLLTDSPFLRYRARPEVN